MLNVDMKFNKGLLVVRLSGVLNKSTSHTLNNVLTTIKENGIKYVLFNLYKLEYVDNYGLDIIKFIYQEIKDNKGKFIICPITKLLEYNTNIMENLYQINEEEKAYDIAKLWMIEQN